MQPNMLRVLIVDDSPEDAEMAKDLLEGEQSREYSCYTCNNAEDAVMELKYVSYDVMLLDFNMPGFDGIWVLSEMQLQCLSVPVVFITGLGNEQLAVQALKMGAQDYLPKSALTRCKLKGAINYAIKSKLLDSTVAVEAARDSLTGMMTRCVFKQTLENAIARSLRTGANFTVLLVNLDEFTEIYDCFGSRLWNNLVMDVCGRIHAHIRDCDSLARFDENTFAVLLEGTGARGLKDCEVVAQRIYDAVTTEAYCQRENTIPVSAVLGAGIYPHSGESADSLITSALLAARECKAEKNKAFVFHSSCHAVN